MREGWEQKKLGEVCSLINRGVAPKYVDAGGIAVLNQKCVRNHEVLFEFARRHDAEAKRVDPERYVRVGDVLVNSTGTGTLGRVAQVRTEPPEATTVDTHITIVRQEIGRFYPNFFGYMLIQIEDEIANSGEGASGQTELARTTLQNRFTVSFPTSLIEQQRIVAILDEAFTGLATATANAEKNLENARELFDSYLNSVLVQVSFQCPIKSLAEVREQVKDGTHNSPAYVASGIPMLDSKHISDDFRIDDSNPEKFISQETDTLLAQRCKPRHGDILISSRGTIGKIAIVEDGQDFNIMGNIILIRLPASIDKKFAAFYLHSQVSHIESIARGVAQKGLYLGQVRDFEIPLPPLSEQIKIGAAISLVSEQTKQVEANCRRKLEVIAELKQSILRKAFSGELTSPPSQALKEAAE